MWTGTPWDWVIVGGLYALGLGAFGRLGGFAGASRALKTWGRATSVSRARRRGLKLPASFR
jgi:hypothetical protein